MKRLHYGAVLACTLGVAACARTIGPPAVPSVAPDARSSSRHTATGYRVLYGFGSQNNDGVSPSGSLIAVNGTLYGTTRAGGSYNAGTIFSVSTRGVEKVLHSFKGGADDGAMPLAGLTYLNGTLYGTTSSGGANVDMEHNREGTVFSYDLSSGKERVLHSFGGTGDGARPSTSMIAANGVLYGTTQGGGASYYGTIFSLTTTGTERVLHSFELGTDGASPSSLTDVRGSLYGTTSNGGSERYYHGTAFSYDISTGRARVLYSFGRPVSTGYSPSAALLEVNDTLYGTTTAGGAYPTNGGVFSLSLAGTETVLYRFTEGQNGDIANSVSNLIDVNGALYGTTGGGNNGALRSYPYGLVYRLTTTGTFTLLHAFSGSVDGAGPSGGVVDLNGTLYGLASSGGPAGGGTVFALSP